MAELSPKQRLFIKKNHQRLSVAEMAQKLHASQAAIHSAIETLQPKSASKRRENTFKLAAILLPLVFFGLLEVGLRVAGYGPNLAIFETFINNPDYWVSNASVGRRYFFVKEVSPATSYDAILKEKPENAFRIFVLGGSSAAGFPYYHNAAFSRMLATRLEDVFPEHLIEVFNLGMPAVNSYAVLDLAKELVNYGPDAFLVYAGHNEFYGALGIASTEALGKYRSFINFYLKLQHSKVFYLLRSVIGWAKLRLTLNSNTPVPQNATLMERMVGNRLIPYRGQDYHAAQEIFETNLRDLIKVAQEHQVPVLIGNVVSNIRDQAPFESAFAPQLDRTTWDKFFLAGKEELLASNYAEALTKFQQAAALDSGVAQLNYEIAGYYEALGDAEMAYQYYVRAKDLDALRFRASEDFNQVIVNICDEFDVPMVDVKHYFEQASEHHLIGSNLMLEHLHPNLDGYFLIAKAFFDSMQQNAILSSEWDLAGIRGEAEYRRSTFVTPLDLEVARLRTETLMSGWPFKKSGVQPDFTLDAGGKSHLEKEAIAVAKNEKTWEVAHVELAEHYSQLRRLPEAIEEYRALIRGTGYNISPHLRLGLLYLEMQRFDEALAVFEKSMTVQETAMANKWIGSIELNRGNVEKGVAFLQRAVKMSPDDPEGLYNLSVGLLMSGNEKAARDYCSKLRIMQPNHPGVKKLWNRLKDV